MMIDGLLQSSLESDRNPCVYFILRSTLLTVWVSLFFVGGMF